jgi:hypothetical protein
VYVTILEKECFLIVGEVVLVKQVKYTRRKFHRATSIEISVEGNEGTRIVTNIPDDPAASVFWVENEDAASKAYNIYRSKTWIVVSNPTPRADVCVFSPFRKNSEERLLASSCLSVCPSTGLSVYNSSCSTGPIVTKFDIWVFFENLLRNSLNDTHRPIHFTFNNMLV